MTRSQGVLSNVIMVPFERAWSEMVFLGETNYV